MLIQWLRLLLQRLHQRVVLVRARPSLHHSERVHAERGGRVVAAPRLQHASRAPERRGQPQAQVRLHASQVSSGKNQHMDLDQSCVLSRPGTSKNSFEILSRYFLLTFAELSMTVGGCVNDSRVLEFQDGMVDMMRRTKMHFVQCLLPQHNAGLCDLRQSMHAPNKTSSSEDIMLNVPLVRQQIRGMEFIDAIRIHRQGECTTLLRSAVCLSVRARRRGWQGLHCSRGLTRTQVKMKLLVRHHPADSEMNSTIRETLREIVELNV